MKITSSKNFARRSAPGLFFILFLLTGCVREISFGGIYLPAWLICSVTGLILGTLLSLKVEPHVVPSPGYMQMLVRFSFIIIVFVITYMIFFVLL